VHRQDRRRGLLLGGGIVNMLATRVPDLAAAVPFYGNTPPTDDVPKIKAPLMIHYAENDPASMRCGPPMRLR